MFFQALIRCACVPLACASVNYFVQHLRRWRTTGWRDRNMENVDPGIPLWFIWFLWFDDKNRQKCGVTTKGEESSNWIATRIIESFRALFFLKPGFRLVSLWFHQRPSNTHQNAVHQAKSLAWNVGTFPTDNKGYTLQGNVKKRL